MKVKGIKQVKKGAKLLLKKQQIDKQLKQLAEIYYSQTGIKYEDEKYFLVLAEDCNKQMNNK